MEKLLGRARWFDHPNAVQAGPLLRQWLADPGSMTCKLRARCDELRVQRLRQRPGNALQDECRLLGLTPREAVEERDVILHCDGRPVLFGHTVTPLASAAAFVCAPLSVSSSRQRHAGDRCFFTRPQHADGIEYVSNNR